MTGLAARACGSKLKYSDRTYIFGICLFLALMIVHVAQYGNLSALQQNSQETNTPLRPVHQGRPQSSARPTQQAKPPEYSISTESNLVLVDVLVTDEDGRVLAGLKKGNFRILDEGESQIITSFAPASDPITIVMVLEYSGLAYDYFAYKAANWGSVFLNHLNSKDWVALVTYNIKPTVLVDFTRNRAAILDALSTLSFPPFREANMFDAVVDTLDRLARVKGKKSILLLTTGADTFSKINLDQTLDRLKRSDVTVFCVGIAEREYMMSGGVEYLQAKNQLQTFAKLTGGSAWFPRFEGEMPSIFRSVVAFLRSQYSLGFFPSHAARDGKYHKVKVEIVAPDGTPLRVTDEKGRQRKIMVYAREGYVAPGEPAGL